MKNRTAFIQVAEDEVLRGKHDWIINTPANLEDSIIQGMPYRSIYAYSNPPNPNEPAPFIFGDLWIVTTDHQDRRDALEAMRRIVEGIIAMHSDIDPGMLRYYLDSGGSVYLRIPAPVFGGDCGVPLLPLYHRQMADRLVRYQDEPRAKMATCTRLSCFEPPKLVGFNVREDTYSLNRPFMFLEPGINHGDNFTVEVDYKSFMNMYPADLWSSVEQGRQFPVDSVAPQITSLHRVYDAIMFARCELLAPNIRKESVTKCPFFKSCMAHPENVDEKKQKLLFGLLAPLGKEGMKMAQEWGQKVLGATESAIRVAFIEAMQERRLVTCAEIAQLHGCDGSCGAHAPYDLEEKEQAGAALMEHFQERQNGLFYSLKGWDMEGHDEAWVCSPIFSTARVCNAEGTGWSREVKVRAPDGKYHQFTIPLRECMSPNVDTLLGVLCEHGLELAPHKHAGALLKLYFREASPARIKVGVKSLGWVGDCYVLPDIVIGHYDKKPEYLGEIGAFQVSGTLEDWISRIGCYCVGNPLPMLVVQYALTAILLGRCGQEGGGLHLYGPSSSGKSTLALVAGSVCGGKPGKGYLTQWRSTANALESTAARHNDGLLVLDEIGEATSDTVFQAIYMLTNGQGKERLRADATAKKAFQWRLNYMSTGEVPTGEKIEAGGRHKVMAGQEVRTINLPVLGPNGENVFKSLHGFRSPAALSEHLKRASKEAYGTLLRAFIAALCGANPAELHANVEEITQDARRFVERVSPKEGVGQIHRVAIKFGLIAAAGGFAARHGLLPWSPEDAAKVAEEWFAIWMEKRGGTGNLEVEKAIKAIQDEWALRRESNYHNLDNYGDGSRYPELHGYYWKKDGEVEFFIKAEIFTKLVGWVNRNELLDTMRERGMLLTTKEGTIMVTKSIGGQNIRGFGFRPSAWLGKAEEVEKPNQALDKPFNPYDPNPGNVF
ncbi:MULTISPECIES: DUF927 domain-containing protein [unclassified Desulfovibrio]|uniref:DUF927 domain-containing protein n=1 Tax=unclassified Desulfovibrio TaxID=2593640 RepID=UPI0013ECF464|nr:MULTISPECIES: DUF927 domain-containing protein [unclassified Desulfovibrio]